MVRNLQLQFNENIITKYKSYKLSVDYLGSVMFILFALYEDRADLLDIFDDDNKEKRAVILYDYLLIKGFLDEASEDSEFLYELTPKAIEFIDFINIENEGIELKEKPVVVKVEEKKEEKVEDWIAEYVSLFPAHIVAGRYLRAEKVGCANKMAWFMKNYGFDKPTIMKATVRYLEEMERNGFIYSRNSSYFIYKQEAGRKTDRISDLATWCERVMNEGDENIPDSTAFDKLI